MSGQRADERIDSLVRTNSAFDPVAGNITSSYPIQVQPLSCRADEGHPGELTPCAGMRNQMVLPSEMVV